MSVATSSASRLLQFHLARSLSYGWRFGVAAGLLLAGIAIELTVPPPLGFAGVAGFFGASLLLAASGYSNRPQTTSAGFWKLAPVDRLDQIVELNRRSQRWDYAVLDITNGLGVLSLGLAGGLMVVAAFVAESVQPGIGALLVGLSGSALLLPIWFSGWRSGHTRADLVQKVKVLQQVLKDYEGQRQRDETVRASLHLQGTDERAVPKDARLQITWDRVSPDFYGVQCQVNINNVQGRKYPYCYFVAVAKAGLDIFPAAEGVAVPKRITVETKHQGDVVVVVIRGHTTRQSGYHTKPAACRELLGAALEVGRRIAARV